MWNSFLWFLAVVAVSNPNPTPWPSLGTTDEPDATAIGIANWPSPLILIVTCPAADDEINTSDIQDTCNKISRYAEDTIQEIGEAQGIFDDKQNGINKKFDVLFKELDDLLKPNVFQRFFTWLSCSIEKVKSYRISFNIVRKYDIWYLGWFDSTLSTNKQQQNKEIWWK